ncbi:MAG: DUF393 domain-containing protein [Fimbriimonadaceae bacterium]|nr:DUF393 domain-containing protein [Fimbriimonadaceae bacterium]
MAKHWLLWDGSCGICSATARWVRRKDRRQVAVVCQYQNCPRPPMDERLEKRCAKEAVVLTADGRELGGADGILFLLGAMGWWIVAPFRVFPLLWISRLVYRLIAANRSLISRVFGLGKSCGMDGRYPEVDGPMDLPAPLSGPTNSQGSAETTL